MVSLNLFKYKHNFYLYLNWSRLVDVLNVLILNGWDDKPNTIDHPKSEHVWLLSHHWSLPSMKSQHLESQIHPLFQCFRFIKLFQHFC